MTADDLDHELTTCRLLACSCPTCKATSAGSQQRQPHNMNIEDLKKEFDQALAQMSDQDIVAAFAAIDCDVEIASEG